MRWLAHVFLGLALFLVAVNVFWLVKSGDYYQCRGYVNLVIALMLLLNHIAIHYTKAGWPSRVMKGIACAWIAFAFICLYFATKEQNSPWGVVIDGRTIMGAIEFEKTLPDEGTPALTKETFDKIRPGMTQQEVLAILPSLGSKLSAVSPEHQYQVGWRQGNRWMTVVFKGDKVLRKEQSGQ
jgi:hypothetical protein